MCETENDPAATSAEFKRWYNRHFRLLLSSSPHDHFLSLKRNTLGGLWATFMSFSRFWKPTSFRVILSLTSGGRGGFVRDSGRGDPLGLRPAATGLYVKYLIFSWADLFSSAINWRSLLSFFQACTCVRKWTATSFMIDEPRRTLQSTASAHTGTRLELTKWSDVCSLKLPRLLHV